MQWIFQGVSTGVLWGTCGKRQLLSLREAGLGDTLWARAYSTDVTGAGPATR